MKRSIYVVDDQKNLLDVTVEVLRCMGEDWEITGFNHPQQALEAIQATRPDAVLTDHMMPGMQGSQLLEQVRQIAPNTIRLIMSGYVAVDKLAEITSAHQYIAKPFNGEKICELVRRTFAAQERITHQGLQQVVTSIRAVPSLRQAHNSLLEELRDPDAAGDKIATLIQEDPGLSVKVLQLANSSLFGGGGLVTDLLEAVNTLGFEMITAIVLSQSVFRRYELAKSPVMNVERVWAHCWETAALARRLCREKRLPHKTAAEAFLAGLLHEVGRFVLFDNFPDAFAKACQQARQNQCSLAPALREVIQATPAQMSAYVLELWGLPQSVINSIAVLDQPSEDPAAGFSLTSALYVANHLSARTAPPDDFQLEEWDLAYLESIGCAGDVAEWESQPSESELSVCG